MTIKFLKLATGIAVASLASNASAYYDTLDPANENGVAGVKYNAISGHSILLCQNECINFGSVNGEEQTLIATYGGVDASGNPVPGLENNNRTVACTDTSNTQQHDALDRVVASLYLPAVGATVPTSTADLDECNVQIGDDGGMKSGWWRASQTIGLVNFDTYHDLDRRANVTFSACTSLPGITVAQEVMDAGPSASGYNSVSLPNGCQLDTVAYTLNHTCDITFECGQFGKSVPVPAFAAAGLGLGLFAITMLTAHRRKIS